MEPDYFRSRDRLVEVAIDGLFHVGPQRGERFALGVDADAEGSKRGVKRGQTLGELKRGQTLHIALVTEAAEAESSRHHFVAD